MTGHVLTEAEYAWILSVALHYRALIFWGWGLYGTQPMLLPARVWERAS